MKEIELLLMSTENELKGQPSLPVSTMFVSGLRGALKFENVTAHLCASTFVSGFDDSGRTCVLV